MQEQVIITGAKFSKGDMEGRPYDSCKIYVQRNFDPSKGEQVGYSSAEYTWGTSDNFYKLRDLKFPLHATIEKMEVISGKSTKTIVTDVQPQPITQK